MTESSVRYAQMCKLADGSEFGLHIHEFIGSVGDGPTLGICGLIHGNEVTGAYIACDLARKLRDMSFKGRVLMLPVANPHGFAENERFTTIDRVNLNRVFPGDPTGTFAQRLAYHIVEEFFTGLDAFVDLHTGTDRPTVDYTYVLNDEGLSRASGSKFLYRPQDEFMVCEAEPGDVLIFDSFVPHGSPPNTSARSRRNLFLTFNRASAGDHRANYYADKRKTYPPNDPSGKRDVGSWRV